MASVLIKHEVEDYDKWREGFDAAADFRKQAGETGFSIYTELDHPNMVFAIVDFEDMDKAKSFFGSDELKEKMKELGVVGEPHIHFVDQR